MDIPAAGKTLLVGEGDFSFCVAMVSKLPTSCHGNITATSLETAVSIEKHKDALQHIEILQKKGVMVILNTDATRLHENPNFSETTFSRIIFNFPHAGGKSNHKKNRKLLRDFFSSAIKVLDTRGQIFMTLCKGQGGTPADKPQRAWHDSWQVVSMAADAGLILVKVLPFDIDEYSVYSSTGFRSQDKGFNTQNAVTHIFEMAKTVEVPQDVRIPVVLSNKLYLCPRYLYNKLKSARCIKTCLNHPLMLTYSHLVKVLSADTKVCDLGFLKPLTFCSRNLRYSAPTDRLDPTCRQEHQQMKDSSAVENNVENLDDLVELRKTEMRLFNEAKHLEKDRTVTNKGCKDISSAESNMIPKADEIQRHTQDYLKIEFNKVLSAYEIHRHIEPSCTQLSNRSPPVISNDDHNIYSVRNLSEVLKTLAEKCRERDTMCIAANPLVFDNISSQNWSSPLKFITSVAKSFTPNLMNDPEVSNDDAMDLSAETVTNVNQGYVKAVVESFADQIVNCLNRIVKHKVDFEIDSNIIPEICSCIKQNKEVILSIGTFKVCQVPCEENLLTHAANAACVKGFSSHGALGNYNDIDAGSINFILSHTGDMIPLYNLVCSLNLCELTCIRYGITDHRLLYSTDHRYTEQIEKLNYSYVEDVSIDLENVTIKSVNDLDKVGSDSTVNGIHNDGKANDESEESGSSLHCSKEHTRKLNSFNREQSVFKAPSLYPLTSVHDMSFWEKDTETFNQQQYFSIIRDIALDNVISVELIDTYCDAASGRMSRCYRLTFQSVAQVLSYDTTWKLQSKIRLEVEKSMKITLR